MGCKHAIKTRRRRRRLLHNVDFIVRFALMSYVTSYYHIIFTTYRRQAVITNDRREDLYRVIAHQILEEGCKPHIINGVHDHLHILLSLSPSLALADLMRNIKSKSSVWMKRSGFFPMFDGWGKEYGAFSLSASHWQAVYDYISSQQSHHSLHDLESEFKTLVLKNGLVFYPW